MQKVVRPCGVMGDGLLRRRLRLMITDWGRLKSTGVEWESRRELSRSSHLITGIGEVLTLEMHRHYLSDYND